MTADEAVKVLKEAARVNIALDLGAVETFVKLSTEQLQASLAALEGKHVYASRHGIRETVFILNKQASYHPWHVEEDVVVAVTFNKNDVVLELDRYQGMGVFESCCFPTRDEAQAEAARRNRGE